MALKLELKPHVGAGGFRFGMTPAEVEAQFGPPLRVLKNWKGGRDEYRDELLLTYSEPGQRLQDITLMPPASAIYEGRDLLSLDDPAAFLSRFDPHPQVAAGVIVFLELGLSLGSFEKTGSPDRSVSYLIQPHIGRTLPVEKL